MDFVALLLCVVAGCCAWWSLVGVCGFGVCVLIDALVDFCGVGCICALVWYFLEFLCCGMGLLFWLVMLVVWYVWSCGLIWYCWFSFWGLHNTDSVAFVLCVLGGFIVTCR